VKRAASPRALIRSACTLAFLIIAWLAGPPAIAQKPPSGRVTLLDRIVAVVNSQVITRHDLNDRLTIALKQLQQQGTPAPPRENLERQVLERMILMNVQLQYARDTGLRIDDGQLDKAIERIASDNQLTLPQLRSALEKDGVTFAKFRGDIREEMIIARLREREVDNKIVVTDGEIDNLLKMETSRQGKADEFNLSHILVRVPEQASPDQLQERRARAEQALEQIKAGVDFRQVAATISDAPDAIQGGAMGWREMDRLPAIFVEALQPLAPGQVSPVLRSPNGFHIVRVNDRRGQNAPLIVTQTHARHILIKTSEIVSEKEALERIEKLKERVDNNANFAEIARLQSEDSSASRGGDLGWLSPGDTVPEFEKAMDAVKIGQISPPVKTPFGWHLIEVLERRRQDMSSEQQRLRARQALRAQKSDEAYQEWVRQLRDKAFVEIRLEER
jgi:peptidyl-prolyl cis-trans isomerase SurA